MLTVKCLYLHFILHQISFEYIKKMGNFPILLRMAQPHCLETKLKHNKMGALQFYIPGFQTDPSYPKQKEFLESTEGNLK